MQSGVFSKTLVLVLKIQKDQDHDFSFSISLSVCLMEVGLDYLFALFS